MKPRMMPTISRPRPGLRPQHVAQFPSQALAQAVAAQARPLLGGSIHYVAGPALPASQVALRLDERPLVLVDGRADISPWVDEAQARRDGVLWLGALDKDAPPPGLQDAQVSSPLCVSRT